MMANFRTPRDALIALEIAYRRGDIEGAVAAKDFRFEAITILTNAMEDKAFDDEIINMTTKVLEQSYRAEILRTGFPDITHASCEVLSTTEVRPGLIRILEKIQFADGRISKEATHAALNENGWHIVIYPEHEI